MARGSKKPNEACASHTELHFYRLVKSHLPRSGNWGPSGVLGLDSRVGLVSAAAESRVRPVLGQFPSAETSLQDLVLGGRRIHHVREPGMPSRLDLRGVIFLLLVIDPSCPERKLLLHIFVVLIAVAVGSNQGASFGITDVLS